MANPDRLVSPNERLLEHSKFKIQCFPTPNRSLSGGLAPALAPALQLIVFILCCLLRVPSAHSNEPTHLNRLGATCCSAQNTFSRAQRTARGELNYGGPSDSLARGILPDPSHGPRRTANPVSSFPSMSSPCCRSTGSTPWRALLRTSPCGHIRRNPLSSRNCTSLGTCG
ncbi:hypothetical protein DFH06DRAFT_172715 [Mycena polygramma]|nr:hypothetical protein DFH06DRAFT_172715 [Mycena polygramma]